jgi:hypothetical protein
MEGVNRCEEMMSDLPIIPGADGLRRQATDRKAHEALLRLYLTGRT